MCAFDGNAFNRTNGGIRKRVRSDKYSAPLQMSKRKRRSEYRIRKMTNNHSDSDSDSTYSCSDDDVTNGFCFFNRDEVFARDDKIYFRASVSESSVEKLIKLIDDKNKEFLDFVNDNQLVKNAEPNPLYLHITSYGGCLLSGFRAVDAIKRSKLPIYTVVDGHAASAATLMSVVGTKRFMTPHSYMLIHQLSSSAHGTHWNIRDEYKNNKSMMGDIYEIYVNHTKMTKEQVEDYLIHDLWWKYDKCSETGLVDELY
jgi:ATP-dependent protease ClpP protease subunit